MPRRVVGLVLDQGIRLAAMGVGVGLVGALTFTRVLRSLLFEVSPFDALSFLGAAALLIGVAVIASVLPA